MKQPDLSQYVLSCTGCLCWQIDIPRQALTELGGQQATSRLIAEAHREHQTSGECVNPEGRVKILGKWVERPETSQGQATGILQAEPYPRWWVQS